MRKLISTGSPFEKTAGYSRAVVQGDWCFVSGTTGYDYATMTMPDTVEAQTRNCLATIASALREGGFDMADVVRAHYYITDQAHVDLVFPILGDRGFLIVQDAIDGVVIPQEVGRALIAVVRGTRTYPGVQLGASPRALGRSQICRRCTGASRDGLNSLCVTPVPALIR